MMQRVAAGLVVIGVMALGAADARADAPQFPGGAAADMDVSSTGVQNRFNGTWKSGRDRITFLQIDEAVVGVSPWFGGGLLQGTVNGKRMKGTWTDARGNGTFTIKLKKRGERLKGKLRDSVGAVVSRWRAEQHRSEARLKFKGYVNIVRPDLSYPGTQRGKTRVRGAVVFDNEGRFSGSASSTNVLGDQRIDLQVRAVDISLNVRGLTFGLGVDVVSTTDPNRCPSGWAGSLTVTDNPVPVTSSHPDLQSADAISSDFAAPYCTTHVHRWGNTDAGDRTSPTWGGRPGGGQWAKVRL